jgi:menaquinone-dependent protoporphyrinogen IX oxidase
MMNTHRFFVLTLVIALPIILLASIDHAVAAWSGSRMRALHPTTMDDPLTFYWDYDGDQQAEDGLGYSVGAAGDVNNDGYDDIIVGAPVYSDTVYREGVAFVFYGSEGGLSNTPDWWVGSGQQGARFGVSVGTAGDVNGDGYDDVVIGAPEYTQGIQYQSKEGQVYVFYGSADGLSTTPDWILAGDQSNALLGASVGTAGDVNNDGYDDIIVGAPQYDNGEKNEGRAYVFLGFGDSGQTVRLFWSEEGNQAEAKFGTSVGAAGDVNNDSYDDVIVGAPRYDNGETDEGAAFVFYGATSGLTVTSYTLVDGDQPEAEFGKSVGTAGDVNGDGYADVIVGAPVYSNTVDLVGAAFAFHGSASGLSVTPTWMFKGWQANSRFGNSVSTAGDVNGDTYDDVVVGAYIYSLGGISPTNEGAVFAFSGSDTGLLPSVYWSGWGGKHETEFGYSVGAAGDVNGDTWADVIIGAPHFRKNKIICGQAVVYKGVKDSPVFYIYLPLLLRITPS